MMKMNGYSLPAQLFSVKKNSSLTRLEISLTGRSAVLPDIQNVRIGRPSFPNPVGSTLQSFSGKRRLARQSTAAGAALHQPNSN